MKWSHASWRTRIGIALAAASLVSIGLFAIGAAYSRSRPYAYLSWNLLLAWVPVLLALWLERLLRRHIWSSWPTLGVTALWLFFLPNSFYMFTDYVHVPEIPVEHFWFNLILFTSFISTGVILGYVSLIVVHMQLRARVRPSTAAGLVAAILFVCSFALYVGRELRWNTWDILIHPAGVLVDVSERVLHPLAHPQALAFTASVFVLLGTFYFVGWSLRAPRDQADVVQ